MKGGCDCAMRSGESREVVSSLVFRLQAGEDSAVRDLVRLYGPRLKGFLRCLVHSDELAEDLMQEVFVKAYVKCTQIESPERLEAWLFALSRNAAYKEMRRKRYKLETPRDLAWFDSVEGTAGSNPVEALGAAESARFLEEALSTLDARRREIMALRYFSDLSLKAIAEVMKIPIGSVGTTIVRSLKTLKKYFDSKGLKVEDLL